MLKEKVFGTLYFFVFRLQMIAVITKNISFDEDLTNFKRTFRYVAEHESSSFYGCRSHNWKIKRDLPVS